METETHRGYYTTEEETPNKSKKVAWFTFWDNDFADKVELDLNGRELIQENGKWFVVKKKPKYPKTYEECCEFLGKTKAYQSVSGYKTELLEDFQKILICRDAYWKIAGEEMGLGKSWEPQFKNCSIPHYCIFINHTGEVCNDCFYGSRCLLVFPTEDMRDAFYENFNDLIERCEELL